MEKESRRQKGNIHSTKLPTGNLVESSSLVKQQVETRTINMDFENIDLSDMLELIKIFTEDIMDIILKKRRRINKKRG